MHEPYEEVEHTADLALRIQGADMRELFANAARAMFAVLGDKPGLPHTTRTVQVDGVDFESLLVNWLNELLSLHEINRESYFNFQLQDLQPEWLSATVCGGPSQGTRTLIKAATLHNIAIQPLADGLTVTVVFDV